MRIGIDVRLWNETGVGRYIRNLVINLAQIDGKNEYVLFGLSKDEENFKFQISNFKLFQHTFIASDIRWHSIREQTAFRAILYKENLDLMHFPYYSLPILYKRPFVVTLHDLIIHHFATGRASTLPFPLYYGKRIAYKRVIAHAIKQSKKIIVPLECVKNDLVKTLSVPEDRISVTVEGFDSQIANSKEKREKSNEKYFLYVGNAYPHKNVEGLIKGFCEFKKRQATIPHPDLLESEPRSRRPLPKGEGAYLGDIKLLLVGKEDFFYERLAEKLVKEKINDVQVLHNINDEELSSLYKGAKALLSASFMEGFGLPPLEAMANGCLVAVSDIPSFKEVCQDTAFYFNPRSVEDIAEILELVLNQSEKDKKRRTEEGLKRTEDFSWRRMSEETLRIYESINN